MMVPLSEIILMLESGVSVNSDDLPAEAGEPGVLKVSCVSGGHFFPRENKKIHSSEISRASAAVRAGDLLVSRANTFDLIGACGIVDNDYPNLYLPDKVWRVVLREPKRDCIPWLNHVLNSPSVRIELRKRATGTSGSMKNIPQASFLGIPVFRPEYSEQKKVASVLNVWDHGLRQMSDLIAAKLRLKQGLMQQLLSGKQRFRKRAVAPQLTLTTDAVAALGMSATAVEVERGLNGVSHDKGIPRLDDCPAGWTTTRLREVLSTVERPVTLQPTKTYRLVTAKRYRAGIVPREKLCGSQIKTATQFEIRSGDFLISRRQIIHGACGLVPPSLDGAVVSNEYSCLLVSDELDPTFFEYLTYTKYLQRTFYQSSVGVALEKMIFRIEKWLDYEIHLPPLAEQKRIVAVLAAIDREIVLLDRIQKAITKQKKGLMQKLITGQVRVRCEKT